MRLRTEIRRVQEGVSENEVPFGVAVDSFYIYCDSDARLVLDNAKNVIVLVDGFGFGRNWPSNLEWEKILPEWFGERCAPDPSDEQLRNQYEMWRTRPIAVTGNEGRLEQWSLGEWAYWMRSEERWWWYWWSADVIDECTIKFVIDIVDDGPLGAVRWLFRACGAKDVEDL